MYIFYLVSAVALSTGVGAFVQYDVASRQKDVTSESRVVVHAEQQQMVSRALRRQFQIDPSRFPPIPSSGYAEINPNLISLSVSGGYLDMNIASFYISTSGDVLGVLEQGPAAPGAGNGDTEIGFSGVPQHVEGLLSFLHGQDFKRGPVISLGEEDDGSIRLGLGGTGSGSEIASFLPSDIVTVGRLDLNALDYQTKVMENLPAPAVLSARGHHSESPADLPVPSVNIASISYEPADFLAAQARLFHR